MQNRQFDSWKNDSYQFAQIQNNDIWSIVSCTALKHSRKVLILELPKTGLKFISVFAVEFSIKFVTNLVGFSHKKRNQNSQQNHNTSLLLQWRQTNKNNEITSVKGQQKGKNVLQTNIQNKASLNGNGNTFIFCFVLCVRYFFVN